MFKKTLLAVMAIVAMFSIQGCSPQSIDAGNEGVVVKQPWFFGHGGVEPVPEKTGLVWTAVTTSVVQVPVRPFNKTEKFADLITSDNQPVDFDVHMTFQHIEGQTPYLYQKFGDTWYESKLMGPIRNDIREFVKKKSMLVMSTDPDVTNELQDVIMKKTTAFIKQEKIPTTIVTVSVGKVMPPESVIKATEETAAQRQRVLTQEAAVKAEQAREIAQRAAAKADKAYMQEMNMSPAQYLKMRELDIIAQKQDVKVFLGTSPVPMVKGD